MCICNCLTNDTFYIFIFVEQIILGDGFVCMKIPNTNCIIALHKWDYIFAVCFVPFQRIGIFV